MPFLGSALLSACLLSLFVGSTAHADFGFLPGSEGFQFHVEQEKGTSAATRAGSHPYSVNASVNLDVTGDQEGGPHNIHIILPEGFFANPRAVDQCERSEFMNSDSDGCPNAAAIGTIQLEALLGAESEPMALQAPIYNLEPSSGTPAAFGATIFGSPIILFGQFLEDGRLAVASTNTSQVATVAGLELTLWGVPHDASHDGERGACFEEGGEAATCPVDGPKRPFLTLPATCSETLTAKVVMDSWRVRGSYRSEGEPNSQDPAWEVAEAAPRGLAGAEIPHLGCGGLNFTPEVAVAAGNDAASAPTGMSVSLDVRDEGLNNRAGVIASPVRHAEIRLPLGFTMNPSIANGLAACSEAQYAAESLTRREGVGCPEASKIGKVEISSPILGERKIEGGVYVAEQDRNPLRSQLALYAIGRNVDSGLIVKMVAGVVLDPITGQMTMTVDDLPPLPISQFRMSFSQGPRAVLASPSQCGRYSATIKLIPWANPQASLIQSVSLPVSRGSGGSACPSGASMAFHPDVVAGSINVAAGADTSFFVGIKREDDEQAMTSLSTKLPPGLLANLRGVAQCPESAILDAGQASGVETERSPPCPPSAQVGRTWVGMGVGPEPAYVSGAVYLAGPYMEAPFSIVAITPAKVGPFDFGTFVLRQPLQVNVGSAQITLNAEGAPAEIPRIMDGVVTHVRDLRIYLDRPAFIRNPTSCEPFNVTSTVAGESVSRVAENRFQIGNCLNLRLRPKISLRLDRGSQHRSHPGLVAAIRPNDTGANLSEAELALPRSQQLDPSRIRGICKRALLVQEACPRRTRYGHVEVVSPLLDSPLRGPVFLVNSKAKLPDLVASISGNSLKVNLRGKLWFARGQLKVTFRELPDVPISLFEFSMPGGRRGILVNTRDLCQRPVRAIARFRGHNGMSVQRLVRPRLPCD